MKRKEKPPTTKTGRPANSINWERVDELLIYGCPGTKIASSLGISKDTLYDRCVIDKGMPFSEYMRQKRECGDNLIQEAQFRKALGLTDKGDNSLLIWLGKNRLDQRETPQEVAISEDTVKTFDSIMRQIREAQEDRKAS